MADNIPDGLLLALLVVLYCTNSQMPYSPTVRGKMSFVENVRMHSAIQYFKIENSKTQTLSVREYMYGTVQYHHQYSLRMERNGFVSLIDKDRKLEQNNCFSSNKYNTF